MKNKYVNKALKRLKLFLWIICILMFIQSCFFKIPDPIIVGNMFLFLSLLVFPWQEQISNKLRIKLNAKNKLFMILTIFIITCIFLHPKDVSYYDVVLSFLTTFLAWLLMILFKKKK